MVSRMEQTIKTEQPKVAALNRDEKRRIECEKAEIFKQLEKYVVIRKEGPYTEKMKAEIS